jgi:CHAD domain-containing protein
MKTRTLLEKLGHFLGEDKASQRQEMKSIREVLKKLKDKEKHLREELDKDLDSDERHEIQTKLDVVHAQRLKGLDRVKELRAEQSGKSEAKTPD